MEQTLTKKIVINLGSEVTVDRAEEVISRLAETEECTPISLRIHGYPSMMPGTGWRIGNALRRFSGESLEVTVPPFGEGDWFRSFTRSGLGYALAAHAGRILSNGTDITAKVRDFYYDKERRNDQNAVFFVDLHRGAVDPDIEHLFLDTFVASLKKTNVCPTNFDPDKFHKIIKLAFECIQNVYDHADRKPFPHRPRIVSYFSMRHYNNIKEYPDPTGRLSDYDERLSVMTGRRRTDCLQVCVNDDGIGIAARQTQNLDVYWGTVEDEVISARKALMSISSAKVKVHDCPVRGWAVGIGYLHIVNCLQLLKAQAVIRTGRLLAYLDGTSGTETGFELVPTTFGYMPGTTLDVLIPTIK